MCCSAGRARVPVLLEDFPTPAATYRPAPAVGRVALPGTGPLSDRIRLPLATRRRHLPGHIVLRGQEADPGNQKVTQAHREREQAQGTLGTADHDTWGWETRANRVRHTWDRARITRTQPAGAGGTGVNVGCGAGCSRPRTATFRDERGATFTLPGGGAPQGCVDG